MDRYDELLRTDVYGIAVNKASVAHIYLTKEQACAADDDGVHAAITADNSEDTVVDDEFTNPPYPRNLTITPGGTTGDVKKSDIVVEGTNIKDEPITETFSFEADATTATVGNKAFKTVTKVTIPAQDGAGATFKIGWGDKLGLPFKISGKPLVFALHNGVPETTAPTLATDDDEIEKNTIDLNSALHNDKSVDIYLFL